MNRIVKIEIRRSDFRLSNPSVVAYEAVDVAPNIAVSIELEDGRKGWGNAAPDYHVTGETAESVELTLRHELGPFLLGRNAEQIEKLWPELCAHAPGQPTAVAAIDIALWDLLGQAAGLPLYRMLGNARDRISTSITLSIDDLEPSVARAQEFQSRGFKRLKIKCGLDAEGDIMRVKAIRSAVDPDTRLCIDSNQGYSVDQALLVINSLNDCAIEFIEQPVRAEDLDGLRFLSARSPIPIMADESVLSAGDLLKSPAPLVNLKLMKTGGITGALRCNAVAEARGISVMFGCMDESLISIAAATHLALALQNVRYADLDGHLDIVGDIGSGNPSLTDGILSLVDSPGLGVKISSF
ncbi:MAG: dipeptide epimerase [Acidobacteria bacterium]|nr:dipeptide epimerase [Acidobacteriota bacterium]